MKKLPSLDLLFGNVWLEVFVEDYVQHLTEDECAFCIAPSGDPFNSILGNALMRNYYVVHDMDIMAQAFGVLTEVVDPK